VTVELKLKGVEIAREKNFRSMLFRVITESRRRCS